MNELERYSYNGPSIILECHPSFVVAPARPDQDGVPPTCNSQSRNTRAERLGSDAAGSTT